MALLLISTWKVEILQNIPDSPQRGGAFWGATGVFPQDCDSKPIVQRAKQQLAGNVIKSYASSNRHWI